MSDPRQPSKPLPAFDPETGGTFPVTIGQGAWWTTRCPACGFQNGVWIIGEGLPPLPDEPDIDCLECGGKLEWKKLG